MDDDGVDRGVQSSPVRTVDEAMAADPPEGLLPVAFHGQTLFIAEHEGEPFTPMRPIVEGMGLDWASQFAKLNANQARWGVVTITIPSKGGPQKSLCMPVRKLPAFFATIHASRVAPELRERIRQYQIECDDVLWNYWRQRGAVITPERDPIPPEIHAAIERRAYTLSLSHYTGLRDDLMAAVRHQAERYPHDVQRLEQYVEQAGTPESDLVVVHRDDLWRLTSGIACAELLQRRLMADLQALEAATGRLWYGRESEAPRS
ncbi:phage antirepressor N-terminal domain-containing protein [Allochromatium vinosum]|uniref:phage antirepressor N-terminal domain-containing protein n=1 Tax=Allochromatium vinosum TaxID=1049 RepID=UPI001903F900|nr:phage antirepressor N-terminal domain-containing protein [Allochromatium vinosum]MBK1655490.1 hypothetical protein [Allochromatium vinosum]